MTEIAKEYASALFELAQEDHTEVETLQALSAAEEQLREHPEYRELLASPGIPKKERLQLIGEAFASLPERVCSFLKLLCGHGYIRELPHCTEEFAGHSRSAADTACSWSAVWTPPCSEASWSKWTAGCSTEVCGTGCMK